MTYLYSNNAATSLASAIDNAVTQLTVLDASLFPSSATPSNPFKVTLQDVDTGVIEICDCTDVSGNVLTVVRGRESSLAIAFPIGAIVHHRLTAENLNNFVQDLENVGTGEGEVAQSRVGPAARFKTLKQGTNTTISNGANEVTIDSADTASGANLGSTPGREGIYVDSTGTQLNLKSLVAGTDIGLSADGEEVTIGYTGAPGESNDGANVGTGDAEIYRNKTGATLNFKRLIAGEYVTLTDGPDTVTIDAPGSPGNIPTGLYTGGQVTANASPGVVDVAAGTGVVVDAMTDPAVPVYYFVSWGAQTVDVTLAGPDVARTILIDFQGNASSTIGGMQHVSPLTSENARLYIQLAMVTCIGGVVTAITPYFYALNLGHHTFYDYYAKAGGAFFPDPHRRQFLHPVDSGTRRLKFYGEDPYNLGNRFFILNAESRGQSFRNIVGHPGSGELTLWQMFDWKGNFYGSPDSEIDVTSYFANGTTLTPIPGPDTAASIILLYHAPEVGMFAEYAYDYYDTINEACAELLQYNEHRDRIGAIFTPTINWLLVGALIARKDATDFTNTDQARIYHFDKNNFRAPFHIKATVSSDESPTLSGELQTNGYGISIQDTTPVEQGRIDYDPTVDGVYLGFIADDSRGFDPLVDGGVMAKAGELTLSGSVVELNAFKGGSENLQLHVSNDGVLYGVVPPDPGWEEVDTDNADYTFPTLGAWVHIAGLIITTPQNVDVGDRIDAFVNLYFQELSGNRGGSIDIGIGLNGAVPTTPANNVRMEGGFDSVISTSLTTTAHGGITAGDTISVFVRRATQDQAQFDPNLLGSVDPSELIVSVPGSTGGGGGGDPTNLGNIPGAASVTITSSTGTNTVLAGAISGTAGVMTGAQVDELAEKIKDTDVTYENLDNNGDVGPGVGQLEPGLGDPATDGFVLSSTAAGVRSWVAQSGGGGIPEPANDTYGYLRRGATSNDWVRGAQVFEQATAPTSPAVGDVWIDTS